MSAETNLPPSFDATRALFCSRPFEASPGVFVRCQSRRRVACPSCAELYRGDWARISRSGIYNPDGHPAVGFRYFFVTLSAPSFGAGHRVPKPQERTRRRCGCGETHSPDETNVRGLPLDLDDYDYAGQVSWHVGLGRLWNATISAMRDRVPGMEFCAVREVQARMALHLHVIVRVPAGSGYVSAESFCTAARAATAAHPVTKEIVGWGQRGVQDREIKPRHTDTPGTMPSEFAAAARVVRYVSKALNYSLKDINPGDPTTPTPARVAFILRLREAARFQVRCPKCTGNAADCPGKGHGSLGYSGDTISVSRPTTNRPGRSFSGLNRTALRARRRAWMEANALDRVGSGLNDVAKVAAEWIRDVFAARMHDARCCTLSACPSACELTTGQLQRRAGLAGIASFARAKLARRQVARPGASMTMSRSPKVASLTTCITWGDRRGAALHRARSCFPVGPTPPLVLLKS